MPDEVDETVLTLKAGECGWVCPVCTTPLKSLELTGIVHDSATHMMREHPEDPKTVRTVAVAIDSIIPLGESRVLIARALMGVPEAREQLASAWRAA